MELILLHANPPPSLLSPYTLYWVLADERHCVLSALTKQGRGEGRCKREDRANRERKRESQRPTAGGMSC